MDYQLLIAIALWCGQPVQKTYLSTYDGNRYTVEQKEYGFERTPDEIQECRTKLMSCLSKATQRISTQWVEEPKCFKKVK